MHFTNDFFYLNASERFAKKVMSSKQDSLRFAEEQDNHVLFNLSQVSRMSQTFHYNKMSQVLQLNRMP